MFSWFDSIGLLCFDRFGVICSVGIGWIGVYDVVCGERRRFWKEGEGDL